MKIERKTDKKIIFLITVVALTALLAILALHKFTSLNHNQSAGNDKISAEDAEKQKEADNSNKKILIDSTNPDGTPKTNKDNNLNKTNVDNQENIELDVKYLNDEVVIKTKLTNISSGDCTLSIVNGQKNINQTAEILYQPQYSTCMGFSVPVEQLGSGLWKISLTINSNGNITKKDITFEV